MEVFLRIVCVGRIGVDGPNGAHDECRSRIR